MSSLFWFLSSSDVTKWIYGSALSRSASYLRLFCEAVCVNLLKLDIKNMAELSATNPISCDAICGKEAKRVWLVLSSPPSSPRYPANICQVHNSAHQETFLCSCMVFFNIFWKYFILFDTPMVKIKYAKLFFSMNQKSRKAKMWINYFYQIQDFNRDSSVILWFMQNHREFAKL